MTQRLFVLATTNSHKVDEIQAAISRLSSWRPVRQPENVPDIEETGTSFADNAVLKAVHASQYTDLLTLGDDSGLSVDALDGRPGIFSARYAPTAEARIRRVLDEMSGIADVRRGAHFICSLAVARKGSVIWTGEGRVEGSIIRQPRGTHGFGYDPIFWIPEFGRTMAELTMDEKNVISHRGRALEQLAKFLESQ
jgi:XTP/dITP diphosphohydrolase